MHIKPPVDNDVAHFLHHTEDLWEDFKNARIFVTGGTGFVGKWLVETFLAANDAFSLNASMVLLSRSPEAFINEMPHIAASGDIELTQGDVRNFADPEGSFTHIIHAATDVTASVTPLESFDVSITGTRRILQLCKASGAGRVLMISSGAVYGRQPPEIPALCETFAGAPLATDVGSAYGQGKRAAEWLACAETEGMDCTLSIARCFAFVGPHLPLDKQFAIGNFISDVMNGRDISIAGDGRAVRSYLHAADMAIWLWTILARGKKGNAYNVGSDQEISIRDLARTVADVCDGATRISIAKVPVEGELPHRYVPSIEKAKRELGLDVWIPLRDGIQRTVKWHLNHKAAR